MTAGDAEYHQTQIEAINAEIVTLRGKADHSAMGRTFNFSAKLKELTTLVEWHQSQITRLDGPFELETQGVP